VFFLILSVHQKAYEIFQTSDIILATLASASSHLNIWYDSYLYNYDVWISTVFVVCGFDRCTIVLEALWSKYPNK